MTLRDLEKKLIYATIEKIELDLLNKSILIKMLLVEGNIREQYRLAIEECTAFLWSEKLKGANNEFDIKKCEYYELTSISVEKIKVYAKDQWLNHHQLDYNIVIEIWESVLLIKAGKVFLNDEIVEL